LAANTKTGIDFEAASTEDDPGVEQMLRSPRAVLYKHYARQVADLGTNEPPTINEEQVVVASVMSARTMHTQQSSADQLQL